jgi:hypothetical protein
VRGGYKSLSIKALEYEENNATLSFPLHQKVKHITSVQLTAETKESFATNTVTTETIKRGDVFSLNSDYISPDSLVTLGKLLSNEDKELPKDWAQFLYGMFEGIVKKPKNGSYAVFSLLIACDFTLSSEIPTSLTHFKNFQYAFPLKEQEATVTANNFFVHKVSSSLFIFYSFHSLTT